MLLLMMKRNWMEQEMSDRWTREEETRDFYVVRRDRYHHIECVQFSTMPISQRKKTNHSDEAMKEAKKTKMGKKIREGWGPRRR